MRTRNWLGAAMMMTAVGCACGVVMGQDAADPRVEERSRVGGDELELEEERVRLRLSASIERGESIEITPSDRDVLDRIDQQAHQRDALWSGLHWHTNLDEALDAARRLNRPVLSLRLLGDLDDAYSCANSRFFRAALYANKEVSAYMRDHFVLHWESVRPVPRITIDYGDGRVIESTITGNSIHYVLTPAGTVADALPGLYGPGVFLEALREAERTALGIEPEALSTPVVLIGDPAESAGAQPGEFVLLMDDAAKAAAERFNDGRFERVPPELAQRAMFTTFSKMFVEMPMLHAVLGLEGEPSNVDIPMEASGYIDRCRLDARSTSLIRTQMSGASEREISQTIASFEQLMAGDTALNEERIRPAIMAMLKQEPALRGDLARLNQLVYEYVFHTPSGDPWMGLRAGHAYTGLWAQRPD